VFVTFAYTTGGPFGFEEMVTMLTVLAVWRLQHRQPQLPRPFRIPGGKSGLAYVVVAPLVMSVVALVGNDKFALKWVPPLALGIVAYFPFPKLRVSGATGGHVK
jgi:hypothetical protein